MRAAPFLLLCACGSASPAPMSQPDSMVPEPNDAGTAVDSAPPMDSGPPPDCTRKGQTHVASVALFDQFLKSKDVDALMSDVAKNGGTPLEDPSSDRIVFLVRGAPPAGTWNVAGDFTNWKSGALAMIKVASDLWALDTTLPHGASHQYKLLTGMDDTGFREDLLAQNVVWDGIDHQTVGEFNAIAHPGDGAATKGRIVRWHDVDSPTGKRDVFVWLPARYDDGSCTKLPVLVVHDGNESLTRGDFVSVADMQPASEQPVQVFVALPSQDIRIDEYTFDTQTAKGPVYVGFLASTILPKVQSSFHVCAAQTANGISGASLGGLISAFGAFEKPQTWGFVGSQSGSFFWDNESLVTRAAQTSKIPVRFYLDHGCPDDNCDSNHDMNAALVKQGYDVVEVEIANAQHDWSYWKARQPKLLHDFAVKATCE